jgi:hypothetical protein
MNSKDLPLSLWEVVPSANSQSSLNSNSIPNPQSPIPNREVQNPEDLLVTDNCSLITEKLMACQTLAELKAFKNQHGEMVNNAYRNLTAQQQLHVDSISATAVPYPVYKYTGSVIEVNGKSLKQGMLVYIDPKVENQNSTFVPVWLMRGLELGWQQAVSVSKDCLHLIEKAITDDDWRTGLT